MKLGVGWMLGLRGEIWIWFFSLQNFAVEHLCGPKAERHMCFDHFQTRAASYWEAPLVCVCVLPCCGPFRWQPGLKKWLSVAFGSFI